MIKYICYLNIGENGYVGRDIPPTPIDTESPGFRSYSYAEIDGKETYIGMCRFSDTVEKSIEIYNSMLEHEIARLEKKFERTLKNLKKKRII